MTSRHLFQVVIFLALPFRLASQHEGDVPGIYDQQISTAAKDPKEKILLQPLFTGAHAQRDGIDYIHQETLIGLNPSEAATSIEYVVDAGEWQIYTSPFQLRLPGEHTIATRFKRQDNTISQEKSFKLFVDASGPQLEAVFNFKSISLGKMSFGAALENQENESRKKFPSGTVLTLIAADDRLSVDTILFSLDNAAEISYKEPFALPRGKHVLVVKASDELGNVTESKEIHFEIVFH